MNNHEQYMKRCLQIAALGRGNAEPNPLVGAVIVADSAIIGEGYHEKFGEAHAEVNAINSVKDKSKLKDATIYVSLEPCAHFGKTPPCSDLIIENKIPNVVVGIVDSFSEVAGKGIEKLKNAGVNVVTGILEDDCFNINRRFFTFHNHKRPWVILKWAKTLDNYIDVDRSIDNTNTYTWITNETSKKLVHKWRTTEQAILIGTNTAIMDNPQLTTREWPGENPLRVVIDKTLKLPDNIKVLNSEASTIVFNEVENKVVGNIEYVKCDFSEKPLSKILNRLYDKNIQSVVVEGGRDTLGRFITEGLWDEAYVFVGDKKFNGGTKAPEFNFNHVDDVQLGNSKLYYYRK